ncbi:MAG: hypothetical protein JO187_12155 [Acidobacteria bacterium]|nr:hypothetical protein [Acidobacteriaceae bacterium]MBV9610302.1 hypothetical protein [Acidobacteriota bacterium]
MFKVTILWVSDSPATNVAARLESSGYAVLSARTREALAVLFVNRAISAVMLNAGSDSSHSLVLARGLRALRPDVPIFIVTTTRDSATQAPPIERCFVLNEDPDQILPQVNAAMLQPAV